MIKKIIFTHGDCLIHSVYILMMTSESIMQCLSLFHTPTGSAHRSVHGLFGFTDVLIGWRASDCDAPTQLLRIQINTGNTAPSPTWRASPTWRKQTAFPLPSTIALWVFWKTREFPAFFRGRGQSYAHWHGTWNSLAMLYGTQWLLHGCMKVISNLLNITFIHCVGWYSCSGHVRKQNSIIRIHTISPMTYAHICQFTVDTVYIWLVTQIPQGCFTGCHWANQVIVTTPSEVILKDIGKTVRYLITVTL